MLIAVVTATATRPIAMEDISPRVRLSQTPRSVIPRNAADPILRAVLSFIMGALLGLWCDA